MADSGLTLVSRVPECTQLSWTAPLWKAYWCSVGEVTSHVKDGSELWPSCYAKLGEEGGPEGRREGGRKENILNTFELNRFLSSRLFKLFNMLTSTVNIWKLLFPN